MGEHWVYYCSRRIGYIATCVLFDCPIFRGVYWAVWHNEVFDVDGVGTAGIYIVL